MGFRRTIAYPAAYGILSSFAVAVGWPAAAPVLAAGPDIDLHNAHLWATAWILFLMVGVLLGYLHLNRRVGRKTAELRRELFERQMAEKELLASQQKLRRSQTITKN